jgi:hypothetical protein
MCKGFTYRLVSHKMKSKYRLERHQPIEKDFYVFENGFVHQLPVLAAINFFSLESIVNQLHHHHILKQCSFYNRYKYSRHCIV